MMLARTLTRILRAMNCRRGATAVEFAMVFPIFLVMVLGIIEVGRAMWIKSAMQFATEEAARFALVNEDLSTGEISTYAENVLNNSGLTGAVVFFNTLPDAAGGVSFVTITATHTFEPLVTIIGMPDFTLTASARTPRNN